MLLGRETMLDPPKYQPAVNNSGCADHTILNTVLQQRTLMLWAIEAVERHVADTETEAHLKRLKEIIRAAGAKGIMKSEITRASQWLKSRDRNEILETLIESGDITTAMRETGGRKAMVYRIIR
jgi:hypothetical protein